MLHSNHSLFILLRFHYQLTFVRVLGIQFPNVSQRKLSVTFPFRRAKSLFIFSCHSIYLQINYSNQSKKALHNDTLPTMFHLPIVFLQLYDA